MYRTTLAAHRAETERRGGAAFRAARLDARTRLLADITKGLITHAEEISTFTTRIDDMVRRWVKRSAKAARESDLLAEAVALVQRIAGGRPLMPFLVEADDADGALVRMLVLSRVLAAMSQIAAAGELPRSPLTDIWALVLDVVQER